MGEVLFAAVDGHRGTPLGVCESCHRPIWRAAYAARGTGEKCGGRIRHERTPTAKVPQVRRATEGDNDPDQLRLFELLIVRVKA